MNDVLKLEDFPEEISDYSTEINNGKLSAVHIRFIAIDEKYPNNMIDRLLNQNAPSLLLSYLRPIVAQVTSASKYGTYNIPFVNFTKPMKAEI